MQTYVVERYVPRIKVGELASDCERVLRALREAESTGSSDVLYIQSIYVPDDEMSFSLYSSPSADTIAAGFERAKIAFDRILEAEVFEP